MNQVVQRYSAIKEPIEKGVARLSTFNISQDDALLHNIGARSRLQLVWPGNYVRLSVANQLMMTDTDMERMTNADFIRRAHGHILIAGLGVGLLLENLDTSKVQSVTIIEKYSDVIDLVADRFKDISIPINYVVADAFEHSFPKDRKFDCIYFDIWPTISGNNYPEMLKLNKIYRKNLNKTNPKSFMDSWLTKECRKLHRENN